ncbi:bestrophin family protein [Marinoscillum pacificum]|uniref:bestrophin family protein n=1 Tax=Marinoscillum pacificum TaxID=392723 RepID=UPI00215724BF|nr:bestrophin family ion channel [Marinoscillum pacificum]
MIVKSKIPILYLFNELKIPLFYVVLIACITGILPIYFRSFLSDIPISISSTLGVAISILLSYMINQSYDRWWEARKIWGSIVNDSRTLILQLQMYVRDVHPEIESIAKRQITWNYCLGMVLRKQSVTELIKKKMQVKDYEFIKKYHNVPLGILSIQSHAVKQLHDDGELDKFSQIKIEETITRLTESMGKCERIKNTVFPPIYRYGLHTSIYLFVIFLSLSVAFKLQHFALEFFILVIVSTVFFFLEKAAFRMQDPFENIPTDTPMTKIAENIEKDILDLLNQNIENEDSSSPQSFYTM